MTVEEALEHMQSGNARFILKSHVSNNQYRYWMRENNNGKAFLVYLIASTGELAYMGSVSNGEFKRTDKSKVAEKAPAYLAFTWVWKKLAHYQLPSGVEIIPIENR